MDGTNIKQLTVLIYNNRGATIGSGTLFVPKSNGSYAYIFTVAHIILNEHIDEKKLKFKMVVDEKAIEFETYAEDSIKCHDKYDKDADVKEYDVAVIKVIKEEWMRKLPTLTVGMPKENGNIHGQGFPSSAYEKNLVFAMLPLNGTIGTCSDLQMRFQINLINKLNPTTRDEELKGYSGSGIYEECYNKTEHILIGIFSYGQGQQAIQNITNSFYSELLRDICKKYGWEEPEDAKQVPKSFEPYVCDAISIIENDKVKNQIKDIIEYIIENGIGPYMLMNTQDDIYDIPKCNNNDRAQCKDCWIARLQLISILAMLGVRIEDLKKPQLNINNKNNKTPIEFFCSEGTKGESQIKQVVRSILDKGYTWNSKFRENAILVWASSGKQTHKSMDRTKFNNVIGDICNEPISKIRKYDTLYGEGRTNNLSIIHIDELMNAIDDEDETNINNKLLEVLENVIK